MVRGTPSTFKLTRYRFLHLNGPPLLYRPAAAMLINCPDCDSEISDMASACPGCARPIVVPILLKERQPATIKKVDEKPRHSPPPPRRDGYVRKASWLLAALTVAAWAAVVAIHKGSNSTPAVESKQTPSVADAAHYDGCTEQKHKSDQLQMELAFGTGILKNDEKGSGLSVFVSEIYWNQMTFEQKTRFVEAFDCAVAGVGKSIAEMKFRSDRTGKTIGEWSWGTLTVP